MRARIGKHSNFKRASKRKRAVEWHLTKRSLVSRIMFQSTPFLESLGDSMGIYMLHIRQSLPKSSNLIRASTHFSVFLIVLRTVGELLLGKMSLFSDSWCQFRFDGMHCPGLRIVWLSCLRILCGIVWIEC